jgi:hypothetical protein
VVVLHYGEHSKISAMWQDLSTRLYEFLKGVSLSEFIATGPEQAAQRREQVPGQVNDPMRRIA